MSTSSASLGGTFSTTGGYNTTCTSYRDWVRASSSNSGSWSSKYCNTGFGRSSGAGSSSTSYSSWSGWATTNGSTQCMSWCSCIRCIGARARSLSCSNGARISRRS